MVEKPQIKKRLHLDFHNHPTVKGIGNNYKSIDFSKNLKDLGVDSVVLFAKCHHGMSYYPTKIAKPHPGLACDLLGDQVKACEDSGIEYHLYLSVLRENYAFNEHPEWRWLGWDGNPSSPEAEYKLLCLNAGYYEDHLKPQIVELLDLYPGMAGIWLDIIRYGGDACFCPNCVRDAKEMGLSAQEFNRQMLIGKYADLQRTVKEKGKELTLNTIVFMGNQKWRSLTPLEIESILAHVGPFHFPLYSRYLNRSSCEKFGITHSFYQNWREFGTMKHPVQIQYEACQMAFSNFGVSLGDELEPDGTFDKRRFPVLKAGYGIADKLNNICDFSMFPVPEVAVIASGPEAAQEDGQAKGKRDTFVRGSLKALMESHYQVTIIDSEEDFTPYKAVVMQANLLSSDDIRKRLDEYAGNGGKVLIMGSAPEVGLDWLGLKRTGMGNANYQFLETAEGERQLIRSKGEQFSNVKGINLVFNSYLPYGDVELGERETNCLRPHDPESVFGSVFAKDDSILYSLPDAASDYYDRGNWANGGLIKKFLELIGVNACVSGDISASAEVSLYSDGDSYELRLLDCSLKRENISYAQQTEYGVKRAYRFSINLPAKANSVKDKVNDRIIPHNTEDGVLVFDVETSEQYLVIGID